MEIHDHTFAASVPPAPDPEPAEPVFQPARNFDPDALTRALRIAGAALVVASASTFMLQHWGSGNDLLRYAFLVGQSLLLAAAAYFVGLTLREGRSARTFLALVLATMPVSFAVLGGLVYSQFHLEALAPLPSYATWIAPSKLSALVAIAGTLAVFVPLSVVAFLALARREARALTLAFLAANLLVIVPLRQPLTVVVLAGVATLGLLRLELTRFAGSPQMETLEAKLARIMPFFAPAIMLGRVFHLYHVGSAFLGGLMLIAAAALWLTLSRTLDAAKRDVGAWVAGAVSVMGWALCWSELQEQVRSTSLMVLLFGVPAAALLLAASARAVKARSSLVTIATATGLGTTLVACGVDISGWSALGCIAVGVAVAVWGAAVQARFRTISGSLVALFGLVTQVWLAAHADQLLRWVSLSAVGVLLIVGSAYVERNRARLARFWERPVRSIEEGAA